MAPKSYASQRDIKVNSQNHYKKRNCCNENWGENHETHPCKFIQVENKGCKVEKKETHRIEKRIQRYMILAMGFHIGYILFVNMFNICKRISLRYFYHFLFFWCNQPEPTIILSLWLVGNCFIFLSGCELIYFILFFCYRILLLYCVQYWITWKLTSSSIKMSNFLPLLGYFAHWNHFYEAQAVRQNLTIGPGKKIKEA